MILQIGKIIRNSTFLHPCLYQFQKVNLFCVSAEYPFFAPDFDIFRAVETMVDHHFLHLNRQLGWTHFQQNNPLEIASRGQHLRSRHRHDRDMVGGYCGKLLKHIVTKVINFMGSMKHPNHFNFTQFYT